MSQEQPDQYASPEDENIAGASGRSNPPPDETSSEADEIDSGEPLVSGLAHGAEDATSLQIGSVNIFNDKVSLERGDFLISSGTADGSNVARQPRSTVGAISENAERELIEAFRNILLRYCSDVPTWFPDRLSFAALRQQVSVTPPHARGAMPSSGPDSAIRRFDQETESELQSKPRRISLDAALRQYQRLVVVGDPGSGKSWALRSLAISALQSTSLKNTAQRSPLPLPLLALAPLLEEVLAELDFMTLSRRHLVAAIVRAMPLGVISRLSLEQRELLTEIASDGRPLLILIDGYDEVRAEVPVLAKALSSIEAVCIDTSSQFVLTTRPSNVPPRGTTDFGWSSLEPFANREQWSFIRGWFELNQTLARRLHGWVREHELEVMRSPLMLSLFCSIVERGGDPPATEQELWERSLLRLASDEGRLDQQPEASEHTRLRLETLERLAGLFIEDNIRDQVSIGEIEEKLRSESNWQRLAELTGISSVIDDLVASGIIRKSVNGIRTEISFLHSAFRDYLIARSLARSNSWHALLPMIWKHPEWEPVIGYLGALVDNPDELLLELLGYFSDDPLNIARLVAGRALAAMAGRMIYPKLEERIRDEILLMLCSNDIWDSVRSASLLPVMNIGGTTDSLRCLLTPSVPSRVIIAAITALAGNLSTEIQETLYSVINSKQFTQDEREAAVNAIADTGTDEANVRIREIAADSSLPDRVRTTAAIAAWTSFDDDMPSLRILTGADGAGIQRMLSERLAIDPRRGSELAIQVSNGELSINDGYSRSIILSAAGSGTLREEAYESVFEDLPMNPALRTLMEVTDSCLACCADTPGVATFIRFIIGDAPGRLRWRVVQSLHNADRPTTINGWAELIDDAEPHDAAVMAEFLAIELEEAPEKIRRSLRSELETCALPPIVDHAVRRRRKALEAASHAPPSTVEEDQRKEVSTALPSKAAETLSDIMSAELGSQLKYSLVRTLRGQIPAHGPVRLSAANLTHQVTATDAYEWIDALPGIAPVVESRLLSAGHEANSLVNLARLRARWPGRAAEVMHSSAAIDARVLDAGAEAATVDGDLHLASMHALASLGASSIDDSRPSLTAIRVLFSSAHATGRANSTWWKIRRFLDTLSPTSQEWTILASWLEIGHNPISVTRRLAALPAFITASDPEVIALLIGSQGGQELDLTYVISWSGCKRAEAMLSAARSYTNSPGIGESLDKAVQILSAHADSLAGRWPRPDLESPAQVGKPKWHWTLTKIASKRLAAGDFESAVAVYEDVVNEDPSDPELVNNLGFCRMPIDIETALHELDAARRVFGRPFGVNTANRMLANFRLLNYDRVLDLGEEFVASGGTRIAAWLWDIDTPGLLCDDVDVMSYIIDIAERAARLSGKSRDVDVWAKRRALWISREEEV